MTREFIMTIVFDNLWDKLSLTDDDLSELQKTVMTNPGIGDIIKGTGGARKVRFALDNIGKSGGIRVIFVDISHKHQTYLVLCYSKNRQDDLTAKQSKQVKSLVETLKGV